MGSCAESVLLHIPPPLPFLFLSFHVFSFFPLSVLVITLLHPCAATPGALCSVLGCTAQEGQGATAEGPGGHQDDEGSGAALQAGGAGSWAHSCPCSRALSTHQLGFVVKCCSDIPAPFVWSRLPLPWQWSTDHADRSRAAASLSTQRAWNRAGIIPEPSRAQQSLLPPGPAHLYPARPVLGLRLQFQMHFRQQGAETPLPGLRDEFRQCQKCRHLHPRARGTTPVTPASPSCPVLEVSASRLCQSFPEVTWIPQKQPITAEPVLISK